MVFPKPEPVDEPANFPDGEGSGAGKTPAKDDRRTKRSRKPEKPEPTYYDRRDDELVARPSLGPYGEAAPLAGSKVVEIHDPIVIPDSPEQPSTQLPAQPRVKGRRQTWRRPTGDPRDVRAA